MRIQQPFWHLLGPPARCQLLPFLFFKVLGFPTRIDHRKKGYQLILTSLLEDLVWVWLSKPMGYHFGAGAPPILEPIFVGIGMLTEGTGFRPMAKLRSSGKPQVVFGSIYQGAILVHVFGCHSQFGCLFQGRTPQNGWFSGWLPVKPPRKGYVRFGTTGEVDTIPNDVH